MLVRMFMEYKPPQKRSDIDRRLLGQMVGSRPKKLSKAPAYLQEAAERMKQDRKKGSRG